MSDSPTHSPRWVSPHAGKGLFAIMASRPTVPPSIFTREISKFLTYEAPVDGALFVFGGRAGRLGDARQYLSSVEYLDPTTLQWRQGPEMKFARVGLAATYLDDSFFVIGGYNQQSGDPQKSVERLVINRMEWMQCAPLLVPRYGHSACACGGKIYVMGGDHNGVLIPFAERYDPVSDSWERIPDMPIRVAASRALAIDKKIFVFGGCDPSVPGDRASDAILMFDPEVNRWHVLRKRMAYGRTAFSIAPLTDGQKGVVIAGGFDLSTRPEVEMRSVEVIRDLAPENLSGDPTEPSDDDSSPSGSVSDDGSDLILPPELPVPRAGCQGVSIPTNLLPVSLAGSSSLPFIVLGGEFVDPLSGRCRVFDSATMLVNKGFSENGRTYRKMSSSSLIGGLAGRALQALKRRRNGSTDTTAPTMVTEAPQLEWSDQILPPMNKKRTAFAACVGKVWPQGFAYAPNNSSDRASTFDDSEIPTDRRERTRSAWNEMLFDWFQGNVL